MTPHQLGQTLRAQVLAQRQRTGRVQGQRLEAVIRDLCADDHQELCAPLCFLVTSAEFAAAVERDPPLAGAALLNGWNRELAQIYARGLCLRLQPALAGLLNLSPTATATSAGGWSSTATSAGAASTTPAPPPSRRPAPSAPRRRKNGLAPAAASLPQEPWPPGERTTSKSTKTAALPSPTGRAAGRFASARSLLVMVLAFLGGVLLPLVLALALGIGIGRRPNPSPPTARLDWSDPLGRSGLSASPGPGAGVPQRETTAPTAPLSGPEPAAPPETSPAAEDPAAAQDRAIRSVQQLYDALASRDYDRARGFFSSQAADQFDPSYLEQYEQVTIQDLRVTGQSGTILQLEGVVSWVQPDGSRHQESRSFSVDTASDPAQVTASAFQRVLR